MSPRNGTTTPFHPRLYHDLRAALHVLYSLNGTTTTTSTSTNDHHHQQQQKAAHEFLMQLQARNVKRKLLSLRQSQNDQLNHGQNNRANQQQQQLAGEILGSSWLPCIKVLSMVDSHPTERLFAAQTLMHRVRRARLSEAIDWEIEADSFEQAAVIQPPDWNRILTQYSQLLEPTTTAEFIRLFLSSESGAALVQSGDEDRIKSEVSLLTLASLTCSSVYMDHRGPDLPLLSTLGSVMAAIALRLRYTPKSIAINGGPVPSTTTIVRMILHALTTVREQVLTRMQPPQQSASNADYYFVCLCSCLAAIPDTILGSPGGARGRLSVDPKCIVAAADELRKSGMHEAWEVLARHQQHVWGETNDELTSAATVALLAMCERWAKYLPIPLDIVQHSLPLAKECLVASLTSSETTTTNPAALHVAFTYVIALLEAGAWTEAQILSFNLGVSLDQQRQQQQATKRKIKSSTKQRKRDMVRNQTTGSRQEEAAAEYRHRGHVACETSHFLWDVLQATAQAALQRGGQADGEGPIGALCACANSCLPYMLRCSSSGNNTPSSSFSQELTQSIMSMFQAVCSSSERSVRGLSYEPLLTLHSLMLSIRKSDDSVAITPFESWIMDHFFRCCMNLASSCAYPESYFDDMSKDNDEELEVERNDVRDVLRTLCGMGENAYVTPSIVTVQVLDRVVHACCEALTNANASAIAVPSEPVVHAFSSLAKPFNHLAFAFVRDELAPVLTVETLRRGMYFLRVVSSRLVTLLEQPHFSAKEMFATCRLAQMAVASFAPAFHAIACKAEGGYAETPIFDEMKAMLQVSLKSAILSVIHIPELYAESTLDHTQYDIIGAMRGPGGEDHVGILVFMRVADEADGMARLMVDVGTGSSSSLLIELCHLHDHLKAAEKKRPPGVMHGTGVTPKSRRILLGTISKVVNLTINTSSDGGGTENARKVLETLFFGIVSSLASTRDLPLTSAQLMYQVCEATFDLASFGADMVSVLFRPVADTDADQIRQDCIVALSRAGGFGYETLTFSQGDTSQNSLLFQWGRLRASQLSLVKSMNSDSFSSFGGEFVRRMVEDECNAVLRQCQVGGPSSESSIFNDDIVSENIVDAGAVLYGISDSIATCKSTGLMSHMDLLTAVSHTVLRTISDPCGQATGFLDPRPTIAEAWYLALSALLAAMQRREADMAATQKATHLVGGTFCGTVLLLLSRSLAKDANTRAQQDKGMAIDGPQVLAMLDFLERCFCGRQMAEQIGRMVASRLFPNTTDGGDGAKGLAIVASSLLRGCSGVLPPWAVEYIPNVFAAIFKCLGEDPNWFCQLLDHAMNLQFPGDGDALSSPDGELLLAGKVVASLSNNHKTAFLKETMDAVSNGSWKRFKVLLKQVCGGKKKASGFNLKPSPTRWEGDRI